MKRNTFYNNFSIKLIYWLYVKKIVKRKKNSKK